MNKREAQKLDFQRIPKSQQLGELAVALATFASFATQILDRPDITQQLFNEPICYAEWLVPEVNTQLKAEIAAIHTSLQGWQRDWLQINANEIQRRTVIKQVREWSEQILDASGLVEERLREVA